MHSDRTVLVANPSADVYGSDLQMLESLSALVGAGYRVIVTLPDDGQLVPKIIDRGAEVVFTAFPVLRRANQSAAGFARLLGAIATSLPRLIRLIRRLQPDAVYVNTITLPWWLLAGRLSRVPTVCHLHEAESNESALVRRALITPLRLAHRVIANSESSMSVMVDADSKLKAKGCLIHNGVPQPPQPPVAPTRERPLRLLSVGRLSPRKAPHLALEVLGELRSRGYDLTLELAGSPFPGYEWYVDQLRQRAAKPDLAGAVEFSGYCSPIWPNLARADIVVQPSLGESFGNAVVEAQYALRPVVATQVLGHIETIADGESGLLVPPEDVEVMAEAVARLVDDPELAEQIARTARTEAIRRFSVERYSAAVVALFDELTGRGPQA